MTPASAASVPASVPSSPRARLAAAVLAVALFALPVAPATATFAGRNGPVAEAWYDNDQGAHQEILFQLISVPWRQGSATPYVVRACSSLDGCPQFSHPAYSADGTRLVFAEIPAIYASVQTSELILATHAGTNPLVISDPAANLTEPSFTPSGRRLVFVRTSPSTSSGGVPATGSIVTSNLAGSDVQVVTNLSSSDPVVSPDGRTVLFVHEHAIWTAGVHGSNPHRLIGNASMPDFSPAGRRIVYVSGSQQVLYVAHADGTHRTPVRRWHSHKPLRNVDYPVFSPDGQQIAFASTDANLDPYLVRVPAGGGRVRGLWRTGVLDSGGTNLGTAWRPLP